MDKISHCELTQDSCIIITDEGKRLHITRHDLTKLAFAVVHFQEQDSVDLGPVLQEGFNWRLLKPAIKTGPIKGAISGGCKTCGPTDWKPKKINSNSLVE